MTGFEQAQIRVAHARRGGRLGSLIVVDREDEAGIVAAQVCDDSGRWEVLVGELLNREDRFLDVVTELAADLTPESGLAALTMSEVAFDLEPFDWAGVR